MRVGLPQPGIEHGVQPLEGSDAGTGNLRHLSIDMDNWSANSSVGSNIEAASRQPQAASPSHVSPHPRQVGRRAGLVGPKRVRLVVAIPPPCCIPHPLGKGIAPVRRGAVGIRWPGTPDLAIVAQQGRMSNVRGRKQGACPAVL